MHSTYQMCSLDLGSGADHMPDSGSSCCHGPSSESLYSGCVAMCTGDGRRGGGGGSGSGGGGSGSGSGSCGGRGDAEGSATSGGTRSAVAALTSVTTSIVVHGAQQQRRGYRERRDLHHQPDRPDRVEPQLKFFVPVLRIQIPQTTVFGLFVLTGPAKPEPTTHVVAQRGRVARARVPSTRGGERVDAQQHAAPARVRAAGPRRRRGLRGCAESAQFPPAARAVPGGGRHRSGIGRTGCQITGRRDHA